MSLYNGNLQTGIEENHVGAVLAGKLFYLKIGAQFLLAVFGEGIRFDSHGFHLHFEIFTID